MAIRKKKNFVPEYHRYGNEILADGFISPLCLPIDRLRQLRTELTEDQDLEYMIPLGSMADYCHMDTESLQYLFETETAEPTTTQLASISSAFGVSVLWLLGYHTQKGKHASSQDGLILRELAKRNAIEHQIQQLKEKGNARDFFLSILNRRLHQQNLVVSNTIARIVATEHIPLTDDELYNMRGQPVCIESRDGNMEWGLCMQDTIITLSKTWDIDLCGDEFEAYLTPDTAPDM